MSGDSTSTKRFGLEPGDLLAEKYRVEELVGDGWEGQVYRVVERRTGVHRAAKLFYPRRNVGDRTARRYARKLNRLRHCPIVAKYHHSETVEIGDRRVTCLVSELLEGEVLSALVARQPGEALHRFEALTLLHALAEGLECIHGAGEYHGDLHSDNVLVIRRGVRFEVKLFDFFYRGRPSLEAKQADILDAVRLFYDALGGAARYREETRVVKAICRGLRHGLILGRFPSASRLRAYLESFSWD